jgi:phospholipase/carboxylesterase
MPETEHGGIAVVLMHGWGASGKDLVSLAQRLLRPKARFFVPAAPLPKAPNGRAWWSFEPGERPAHAVSEQPPAGYQDHPQVLRSRSLIQELIRQVQSRYAPQRVVVAGFSQGGILSLDVALAANPPVDRVVVMSGVLIAESLAGLRAPSGKKPLFFFSHGKSDPVLPFQDADLASQLLRQHGFAVTLKAFEGGHQIPPEVVEAVADFIYSD